jgi:hypothetical protein
MSYKRDRRVFRRKVRMRKLNFEKNLNKQPKEKERFGWYKGMKLIFSKKS